MNKKEVTQNDRILIYIGEWGSITTFEAFADLGITRLASRINDLEKMGHRFKREVVTSKNRYGEPVHYTRYSFERA